MIFFFMYTHGFDYWFEIILIKSNTDVAKIYSIQCAISVIKKNNCWPYAVLKSTISADTN